MRYSPQAQALNSKGNRTETMDQNEPCSETSCNIYEGAGKLPFVTNAEVKTENEENMLDINKEGRTQTVTFKLPGMPAQVVTVNMEDIQEVIHVKVEADDEDVIHSIKVERIDEIEREDFEEENRILNCSEMVMDNKKMEEQSHFPGNLSSANSSLASSSETISNLSNLIKNEFNPPGCSRTDENCDSNTTIKNMIQSKNYMYPNNVVPEPPKQIEPVVFKNDFMKTLLASGPANVEEKVYNKGRLYKGDRQMEQYLSGTCDLNRQEGQGDQPGNGSGSSERNKDAFTVSSTSNADKLLGLTGGSSTDPKHQSPGYSERYEDDDSSDDSDELCTCLSSHEDDEESDILETSADERLWRKRRYEAPVVSPPQSAKKFCMDGASGSGAGETDWPPNLPGTSLGAASIQGPPEVKQWLSKFQSWSNGEKIQAIEALISRCAASQVRHMMKAIEPLFQRDFISLLPKELALTVLGYLKPKDLLRAAQTCRYWRFLADDNLLWKEQCRRIGIVSLRKLPRALPRCASLWKSAYMRQYLIEDNWLHKPVTNPTLMRGHDDHVITCLQFYGSRILSGSDDTTLKVWSAITGKCLTTLVGHSGGVWSSQMVGDLVISGSTDRTLRVWDAKSGQCKRVLSGHTSTVRCMHLHGEKVVSGSRDATLRLWSIKNGACLRVLIGHLAAVRCVQYDGKVIVSGAYDYFVKIWNPNTGECLHTLAGHTNRVYSLQFDGIHVVSGSLDTSIRVWDVETGQLKHTLIGHQSLTSGMELHSNILVSGNADSTVKVWDINTGHCLHTLSGPNKHQSAVTCLQTSNRFVITSSDDGTVKLWDVRTGEFIRNLVQLSSRGSGGVVWRIRASTTKLICAVGSRNGTEETKLLVLDFDVPGACRRCDE